MFAKILGFSIKVMEGSAEKIRLAGNPNVMVCERGTMHGYSMSFVSLYLSNTLKRNYMINSIQLSFVDDLIFDPRNLEWLREAKCPVVNNLFSMSFTS